MYLDIASSFSSWERIEHLQNPNLDLLIYYVYYETSISFLIYIYKRSRSNQSKTNIYLQETEQEKADKGYVLKRERSHSLLKYIDKYQRWHISDRIYMIYFFFGGGYFFVYWSKRHIIYFVHFFYGGRGGGCFLVFLVKTSHLIICP